MKSLQRPSADRQIALESASRSEPAYQNLQNGSRFKTPQTTLPKSWWCSPLVVITGRSGNSESEQTATAFAETWRRCTGNIVPPIIEKFVMHVELQKFTLMGNRVCPKSVDIDARPIRTLL